MPYTTRLSPTYRIPWASSTLAGEGVGHPRVLVSPVPDGDTDASLDVLARRNDVLVVLLLLREQGSRRREGHADIELSDSDLNAGGSEHLKLRLEVRRDLADDEVALETDTVEPNARGLERLDEVEQRGCLRAGVLDVVFVDVDLGARVCCASGVEGDLDVVRAEGIVEDVATPGAIVVASFL